MTKIENPTEIRKRLLAKGRIPLANLDKRCVLKGWSKLNVTTALIDSWSRKLAYQATGQRLDREIQGDLDVNHPVIHKIVEGWEEALPAIFDNADVPLLERGTTASMKLSFFFRHLKEADEPGFTSIRTKRYMAPGANCSDDACQVEFLAGSGRQAGSFGAHKVDKQGNVLSEYVWPVDSPLDVHIDDEPGLTKKQCYQLANLARQIFEANGFVAVKGSKDGEHRGDWVYDVAADAQFDCVDGVTRSLDELKEDAAGEEGMRCSASWLEGPTSVNRTRCLARADTDQSGQSRFYITDFDTNDKHMELSLKPAGFEELGEALEGLEWNEAKQLPSDARGWAEWITSRYAYCPSEIAGRQVVSLKASTMTEGMSLAAFRISMLPYADERQGPRGGRVIINPVDIWIGSMSRVLIEGRQLRPDLAGELFTDARGQWLNIYRPPVHIDTGGDPSVCVELIRHLLPDQAEHDWFMQALAHKFRNPAVPGPGIIMVAQGVYGAGRGTLVKLIGALFGDDYVHELPFHVFAGKSYQSQYNTWAAESLFVIANETTETQGASRHAVDKDTAAHLRELVDPRARRIEIISKGVNSCRAMAFYTGLLMTNEMDRVPLPDGDRRWSVLLNGDPMADAMADRINAGLDDPAVVAAFVHRVLMKVDLTGFNAYRAPPMTDGKRAMIEAGKSDLDRGLDIVLRHLKGRSEIFSAFHVINGMAAVQHGYGLNYPDDETWQMIARRMLGNRFCRVGVNDGQNDSVLICSRRWKTYAWTRELARKWHARDAASIRMELERAGALTAAFGSTVGELGDQLDEMARQRANSANGGGTGGTEGGTPLN